MRRLKTNFFVVALALGLSALCLGQTAEQLESPAVNRIADKLNCPCGCKQNMACRMDPYPCRTCWDNKKKIFAMEQAGMSDQQILASFAKEMGPGVILVEPGFIGSMLSYTVFGLGLILVAFVLRKYKRKEAVVAASEPQAGDDPLLSRYRDQIDKEVDKLD